MASITIALKGVEHIDRLRKRMARLPFEAHLALTDALRVESKTLENTAQQNAPVDSGVMKASYRTRQLNAGRGSIGVVASYTVPPPFNYAKAVHEKKTWSRYSQKGAAIGRMQHAFNANLRSVIGKLGTSKADKRLKKKYEAMLFDDGATIKHKKLKKGSKRTASWHSRFDADEELAAHSAALHAGPKLGAGGAYPNYHWFKKAGELVSKGMLGRIARRLRPVLRNLARPGPAQAAVPHLRVVK